MYKLFGLKYSVVKHHEPTDMFAIEILIIIININIIIIIIIIKTCLFFPIIALLKLVLILCKSKLSVKRTKYHKSLPFDSLVSFLLYSI